jgi:glyoxylase-like metal-dependent hydrolase (beta-lactamase superfamily II)
VLKEKKGISAEDINQVIFRYHFRYVKSNISHVHWDHCSSFSSYFPKATALFGPSSIEGAKPGYPTDPNSLYFSDLVDHNHPWSKNVEELPPPTHVGWKPFGTFERAWDLFGDESFWLIDAPGHVKGNIAAAGRLGNGEWIVMGGDCAHSR